ncbi:NAD(P)-dependent oxidoreductase [Vibrio sp. AK197]
MKPVVLISTHPPDYTRTLLEHAAASQSEVMWVAMDDPRAARAEVAACWYPHQSLLQDFPDLKCLHSLGAGVDNLGPLLDSGLEIERIIDPQQKRGMFEYVLWGVLYYQRDLDHYQQLQSQRVWQRAKQRAAKELTVGVLGLGEIGAYVATELAKFGYSVMGWSRSKKSLDGVLCFTGLDGLDHVLEGLMY